jgi:putative chitinase
MITTESLRRYAPKIKDPDIHATALEEARKTSSVTTLSRLCHFMGQIYVETGGFANMSENLNYKKPADLDKLFSKVHGIEDARYLIGRGPEAIANRVYADRNGNGNEACGDGWRYRGSGYVQLTGRSNYKKIGVIVKLDLEGNPDLAREPEDAARIAFAFWDALQCSPLADRGDVDGLTEKINGSGKLGVWERRNATLRALGIWKA